MRPQPSFGRHTVLAVVGAIALTGCTDLSAVQNISQGLRTASSSWTDVHGEFAASCERRTEVAFVETGGCTGEELASEGLASANKVLFSYFTALKDVSAEQSFSVQDGLTDLTTSVGAIPGVSEAEVKAVSGLAGTIMRLALRSRREKTLRLLIDEGGNDAVHVIELLERTVPSRLGLSLDMERTQLTSSFVGYVYQNGSQVRPADKLCEDGPRVRDFQDRGTSYLLAMEYCDRLGAVDARDAALEDYSKSLASAKASLTELMSSNARLGAKDLAQDLYANGKDLADAVGKVETAFAGGDK